MVQLSHLSEESKLRSWLFGGWGGVWLLVGRGGKVRKIKLAVQFDIVEGRIWKWVANEIPA